jgi:2-hydroxy-3-oxopropionate reductase
MKVGFIGLGIMGRPMCKNLIKAGYDVIVIDRRPEVTAELTVLGAASAKTPKDVAAQADVIITMLPNWLT